MASSTINVKILGDARKFKTALGDAESGLSKFAGKAATVGKAAAVGIAAVTAAVAGIGVAAFKLGENFDAEFDKIRVGTGATGDALNGLQDDFKTVLQSVPTDFAGAGTAIADLNTRLGLTGAPLQELSGQFINLSRITETDLAGNIDNLTRVFGDAGLKQSEYAEQTDKIYRAAQASGIGIGDLSKQMVDYGAATRNLGFDIDESTALFALFNKTGVNTETVFAGLKAGVGKLAKAGEDVPETFSRIVDEISAMGPGTEATAKAIELFGQRAGPDLADAIAGGKFEIDEMMDAIKNGEDTINGAAEDTADFSEKWLLFKNKVLVGLEPLATKVFEAIGTLMDKLGPKIQPFIDQMSVVLPVVFARVQSIIERWGPVVVGIIEQVVSFVQTNFPPIRDVVLGVFETISVWVAENWPAIRDTIVEVMTTIGEIITAVVELISVVWAKWGDEILLVVETIFKVLAPIIQAAMDVVLGVIRTVTALIRGDWSGVWNGIKATLSGVWDGIKAIVSGAIEVVRVTLSLALNGIKAIFSGTWNSIVATVSGLGSRIASAATGIFDGVKDAFRSAINWVIDKWNNLSFSIPKITIPGADLGPLGTYGGGTIGGQTFSTANISRLAGGAVFDQPTLLAGADGGFYQTAEYPGAKRNREIVTPEALLNAAFERQIAPLVAELRTRDKGTTIEIENFMVPPGRTTADELNYLAARA